MSQIIDELGEAEPQDRVRLALDDEELDEADVSTFEIERDRPSYSWETATHFHERFPGVEWNWILGADQWNAIDRWAAPGTLRRLLRFIILTRNGEPVLDRPGWRSVTVPFEHPASSTAIRGDFEGHAGWMTPSVRKYCEVEGLYRG